MKKEKTKSENDERKIFFHNDLVSHFTCCLSTEDQWSAVVVRYRLNVTPAQVGTSGHKQHTAGRRQSVSVILWVCQVWFPNGHTSQITDLNSIYCGRVDCVPMNFLFTFALYILFSSDLPCLLLCQSLRQSNLWIFVWRSITIWNRIECNDHLSLSV